ncbi:MAG: SDR family oxidoreductase [Candidatus Heimdallarchaeota archaeon]|nr:SDR family oxidoreductase [Candidatus Heimdallarchaeota archaeon]
MDTRLKEKNIIVTGAAGGIGTVICRNLGFEGANVIIHYNSSEKRAKMIEKELIDMGTDPMVVQADLSDESDVLKMYVQIEEKYHRIDGLVNNAGKWPQEHVMIKDMTYQRWKETIANNLHSSFLCTRAFLMNRVKYPGDYASIVLIGSTAADFGEAGHLDYAAAKAGLSGLMMSLKNELPLLARYGRINMVSPGWTVGDLPKDGINNKENVTRVLQTISMRKIGRGEDIANAVLYLLSDALSHHTNGQKITVAGGMEGRVLYEKEEVDPSSILIEFND